MPRRSRPACGAALLAGAGSAAQPACVAAAWRGAELLPSEAWRSAAQERGGDGRWTCGWRPGGWRCAASSSTQRSARIEAHTHTSSTAAHRGRLLLLCRRSDADSQSAAALQRARLLADADEDGATKEVRHAGGGRREVPPHCSWRCAVSRRPAVGWAQELHAAEHRVPRRRAAVESTNAGRRGTRAVWALLQTRAAGCSARTTASRGAACGAHAPVSVASQRAAHIPRRRMCQHWRQRCVGPRRQGRSSERLRPSRGRSMRRGECIAAAHGGRRRASAGGIACSRR
jgi:hypothetical protein